MSGAGRQFRLNDKKVKQMARDLSARLEGADTKQLMRAIGAHGVFATQRRFERGEGPGGIEWPISLRALMKGEQTLIKSGRLRDSIAARSDATRAEWGTNVEYAGIHQFGGTTRPHVIVAKRAKALNIPGIGPRKKVNHPGSKIPARPYLGLDAADEAAIMDIVENWLRGTAPA